ncbi:uncharacterized protein LOC116338268 [Contarinia nasturtii]|uniref:uncharacterized protein LOC116338268 n=1 Tax=Contarinia nasturtii TaxID=265458 RepID=UPI0012D3FE99|nr:uncharacterized protein LOC116338268 [Contarinia nasturtii]
MDYTPLVEPSGLEPRLRLQFFKDLVAEEKKKLMEEQAMLIQLSDAVTRIFAINSAMRREQYVRSSQIHTFVLSQNSTMQDVLNAVLTVRQDSTRLESADDQRKLKIDRWCKEVEEALTANQAASVTAVIEDVAKKNEKLEKMFALKMQRLTEVAEKNDAVHAQLKAAKENYQRRVYDLINKEKDVVIQLKVLQMDKMMTGWKNM